jgi:RHS repeat-associated protein
LHDDNDYRSYGTLSNNYGASPSDNHYLFTGYESDSETTSDYAVNRNLGMTMGRFNRPDPYDGSYDQTNPQSLNRYNYVGNNPLVNIDPSGLQGCFDAFLFFGIPGGYCENGGTVTVDGLDEPYSMAMQELQSGAATIQGGEPTDWYVPGVGLLQLHGWQGEDTWYQCAAFCSNGGNAQSIATVGPHGPAGAPNNPPAPPATPPQQQGNSWSHPFTPPTCSQIGHGAAADLAISFAATGGGKTPPNPVSALFGWTGMAEATFYGLFCQ